MPPASRSSPRDTSRASGNISVRVPADLHVALIAEAERQGVSLNLLIATVLAGGVGWQRQAADPESPDPPKR